MLLDLLQDFVRQKRLAAWPDFVIKNSLKEYLQFPVLAFLYSQKKYQEFIFIGGSALRIIHGLPRLSEDLDFNLPQEIYSQIDLAVLGRELQKYFADKLQLAITYRVQGHDRLYLKFPVLRALNLSAGRDESDFLYVKIELSVDDLINPEYELAPVSGFGFNFIVKTYSLKFLMTGKISAILSRSWFKGENNKVDIKGRDYYDLYWYLNKGVEPDFVTLAAAFGINNQIELKDRLREQIDSMVSPAKLRYDLLNFFSEQEFIANFCDNYSAIMKKFLD